jgi:hypothetical protein
MWLVTGSERNLAKRKVLKGQSKSDLTILSNRLMPLMTEIQKTIKTVIDLLSDTSDSKDSIIKSCM